MKTLRAWLMAWVVLHFSPQLFAQYTLLYSTNAGLITLSGYTGTPVNITISNFVTSIGNGAFNQCYSLSSVTISDSVTNIEDGAFSACLSLSSISIPDAVTAIGTETFQLCSSLDNVIIGAGLTTIGDYAFAECDSLSNITLPAAATNIGIAPFVLCQNLTNISVAPGNSEYTNAGGALCDVPRRRLAEYPEGNSAPIYAIPSWITNIAEYAFANAGNLTNVIFPTGIQDIEDFAFSECTSIGAVSIPNSVTTIGADAFEDDFNAESIVIGTNVISMGDNAFANCISLTNVEIPASVSAVGIAPFFGCTNLLSIIVTPGNITFTNVAGVLINQAQATLVEYPADQAGRYSVPPGVTTIGPEAFAYSGLTSITIPSTVSSLGFDAFESCSNLAALYFQGNAPLALTNAVDDDTDATVYYVPATSGWGQTYLGLPAVMQNPPVPSGSLQVTFNFPDFEIQGGIWQVDDGVPQPDGATVTGLTAGYHAITFSGSNGWTASPQTVFVSANTTTAATGDYFQFNYCTNSDGTLTLTNCNEIGGNVTIPSTIDNVPVTSIGAYAFSVDLDLHSIAIPDSVLRIESNAFMNCGYLTNIQVGNGITNIGDYAFYETGVPAVFLPNSVRTIGHDAFFNCVQMTNLTLGTNVACIGSNAFEYASIKSIFLPDSLTNLGYLAFCNCQNLGTVRYPTNLAEANAAFAVCPITNIEITDGTAYLGGFEYALLTNLNITNSVASIGNSAFASCTTLTNITLPYGLTNIGSNAFLDDDITNVVIPDSVVTIAANAFEYCSLQRVSIGKDVATIGDNAFSATELTNVIIPEGVTNIGAGAFAFSQLQQITFGSNIMVIEPYTFANNAFADLIIPDSVRNIGSYAFSECANLINVSIGRGVTNIGANAFYGCPYLYRFTVDSNNPAYSSLDGVLFDKSQTTVVQYPPGRIGTYVIPETVTNIGNSAFYACSLSSLVIPGSVTIIGDNAFANSDYLYLPESGLEALYFQGNAPQAGNSLFTGDTNLMAYYLPGTAGWSATFAGISSRASTNELTKGISLVTQGSGSISHGNWPKTLMAGETYTVKADPKPGNIFVNWTGGTNSPYTLLSANSSCTFTMQANLVLDATFIPNEFGVGQGAYYGLFGPENARAQTNSGSFSLNITGSGVCSGALRSGTETASFSGRIASDGTGQFTTKFKSGPLLAISMQVFFGYNKVTGTVTDGSFVAGLIGYQDEFSSYNTATGGGNERSSVILSGANDPSVGPYGVSYGTLTVNRLGHLTFTGHLADGTSISQSTIISENGNWPFYVPLYGGKGSIWGWVDFIATGTNSRLASSPYISWISPGNPVKTAAYRAGFTNQIAVITGSDYEATNKPLIIPSKGIVIFEGGGLTAPLTNQISVSLNGDVSVLSNNQLEPGDADDSDDNLRLTIQKATGVISGSFSGQSEARQTYKFSGVILQDQGIAEGFFLNGNESGSFEFISQ